MNKMLGTDSGLRYVFSLLKNVAHDHRCLPLARTVSTNAKHQPDLVNWITGRPRRYRVIGQAAVGQAELGKAARRQFARGQFAIGQFARGQFAIGPRAGLTLIELLVVVVIVGIMAALLSMAVFASRTNSRDVTCRNNLRQFAIGALNFESSQGHLPPGTLGFGSLVGRRLVTYESYVRDEAYPYYRKKAPHTSFQGILLPYLEQSAASDQLSGVFFKKPGTPGSGWYANADGFTAVSTNAPAISFCPADSLQAETSDRITFGTHPVLFRGSDFFFSENRVLVSEAVPSVAKHQGTNYAGCVGVQTGDVFGAEYEGFRGAMTSGERRTLSEIRDGNAATYLFGETLGQIVEGRRLRRSWLIGGLVRARGSVPWGEDAAAFAGTPSLYLGNSDYAPLNGFGSMHRDFVNFAMVDGSTDSVSRDVDWQIHFRAAGIADQNSELW